MLDKFRISFTGTQKELTKYQEKNLLEWLNAHTEVNVVIHGNCHGADTRFHQLVRQVYGRRVTIIIFPALGGKMPIPEDADIVHDPRPPLERNVEIVTSGSDQLLAAPRQMWEIRRSGTWTTVRRARERFIPIEYFWPHEK